MLPIVSVALGEKEANEFFLPPDQLYYGAGVKDRVTSTKNHGEPPWI